MEDSVKALRSQIQWDEAWKLFQNVSIRCGIQDRAPENKKSISKLARGW